MDKDKHSIQVLYGFSFMNPDMHAKFLPPEPLTWREWVHGLLVEFWSIAVPSFWLALSITAFRWSFGAL